MKRIEQSSQIDQLKILGTENPDAGIWPFFMVILPDRKSRDMVLEKLWSVPAGVSRLFIHDLKHYDYLKPYLGKQKATPDADDLAERMLTVSNSPWLDPACFNDICKIIYEAIQLKNCGLLSGDKDMPMIDNHTI